MDLDVWEKVRVSDVSLPLQLDVRRPVASGEVLQVCFSGTWETRGQCIKVDQGGQHVPSLDVTCSELVKDVLANCIVVCYAANRYVCIVVIADTEACCRQDWFLDNNTEGTEVTAKHAVHE